MIEKPKLIIIHDLVDPKDEHGRTYKEINLTKSYEIPIGTLVEIIDDGGYEWEWTGCRLYVCRYSRDCDGTPLYSLGSKGMDNPYMMHSGFSKDCLKVIRLAEK